MNSIDYKVKESKKDKNHPYRNELLKKYKPFILKNVSKTTGRYVSSQNSDEFIVGMEAFNEAIDRYDDSKGSFLNYASIIIDSRVKDLLRKDNYYEKNLPILDGEEFETTRQNVEVDYNLKDEIYQFKNLLHLFEIDIEDLVDKAPKHKKTRKENIELGRGISKDDLIVEKLYLKRKLPMADIIIKFDTTKKKLKTHRDFIISVVIIFKEKFSEIMSYMEFGGESHE